MPNNYSALEHLVNGMDLSLGPRIVTRKKRRWLLVSNCQAIGLGNCLTLLSPDIAVESYDPIVFKENRDSIVSRIESFDQIIYTPSIDNVFAEILAGRNNVWMLPGIIFFGYHPDLCDIRDGDNEVTGPLGGYQSMIARAAFLCGLCERQALGLYRQEVFERLGYLSYWRQASRSLIDRYDAHGFDIRDQILLWSRNGPFMHTPNHPKIGCLRGLAEAILRRSGLELSQTDIVPHDNLANGPIFPVYPEIGSVVGVRGNYIFKFGGGYQCMSLADFVVRSFEIYRSSADLKVSTGFQAQLDKTISVIKGA